MFIYRAAALLGLGLFIVAGAAAAAEGLVSVKSRYRVEETLDRFENAAKGKGLNIFLRLDHAPGARKIGKTLRPTELLVFGSPQGGTPLMECAQSAGIDLPLKALAWQDASGQAWLACNDPQYLAGRHELTECGPVAQELRKAPDRLAQAATK